MGLAVVVGALLFPLAAQSHDASDFFIFARATHGPFADPSCTGGQNKHAEVSGSTNEVEGRIHSNADLSISGQDNVFHGDITMGKHGESSCFNEFHEDNIYEEGDPEDIDGDPTGVSNGWPGDLSTYMNGDTVTFGSSISQVLPGTVTCDVGNLTTNATIEVDEDNDGDVVCNGPGGSPVKLSAQNQNMSITIVAHSPIEISGQGAVLRPAKHEILAWTDYELDVAIKLAGSNLSVPRKAILFSSQGGIDTSGSTDADLCIQLIGQGPIKVPGSNSVFGPGSDACVDQTPDVLVQKSPDGGTVNAGDTATFSITVTNNGPGSSTVTLSDNLPDGGLNWSESSDPSNSCTVTPLPASPQVLSCNFGILASGDSRTVSVSTPTGVDDCGTKNNTVTITASGDINTGNNSDTGSITIQCPDVSVVKTPDAGSVNAGSNAVFSMTVTNHGPGSASNVTLNDPLPNGGLNWSISSQPAGNPCSITGVVGSQVLSCNFGTLTQGETRTVEVTTPTLQGSGSCGVKNNTATVSATGDTNSQNNSDAGQITVQCPDISVVKTPDAGSVNAGSNAVFSITLTNNGPGSATNVTLNDPLPNNGLNWSITVQPGGCSVTGPVGNQVLSCSFGTLTQGATRTVEVTSPTTSAACGVKNNTVTVTSTNDNTPNNNSDTGQITVNCPDVSVVKTPDAGTVNAGSNAVFSITVTNNGPGSASNVTLNDPLPNGGLNWSISSQPAGDPCSITGPIGTEVLSCNFGTLTQGATRTVEVSSPTLQGSGSCGVKNNTATITATGDTNSQNNSDAGQITVLCPDVSVVKTPDGGTVNAGDTATFSITVTNNGPGPASNVTLNDNLPNGGLNWSESADPSNACSVTGPVGTQVLSCSFGTVAQGDTRTVSVSSPTVQGSGSCGPKNNTVTVSATGDVTPANNTDTGSITILCPDVSVVKTPDAGSVNAGSNAVFSITVTNNGPGPAANVTLSDNLPDGGLNWSISSQPGGDPCSITGVPPNQVLGCTFGTLAQGATRTVEVTSPTTSASCGVKNNTVTVSATGDVTPANNTDTGQITVNCPDVSVQKTPDGTTVQAGEPISFSITVTNNGPGTAANVTLSDNLPAGFEWQLGGPNAASCLPFNGTTLSCNFGAVTQGDTRTVTLTSETQAADCATVNNTAVVSASGDTNSQNNSDQGSVTIQCPNVSVSKTPDAGSVNAGSNAVFSITVTNNGPGPAANVTLSDNLPDGGLNWSITDQPAGNPCQITGAVGSQVLSCSFGTLAQGASRTVQVTSPTLQGAGSCGAKPNTVTVSATGDVTPANNTDTGLITVNCPDVSVEKTGSGTIDAGDVAEFSITITNNGPGSATGVALSDDLPGSGWTIFSQTGSACSTADGGSTLSCSGITLAEDAEYTVVVRKTTTADDCGTLPNTATVSAANEPAGQDENNSDDHTITVECPDVTVEKTGNGTIDAGDLAVFTITITNNGPGQATGVGLNDDLPGTGWTIDSQDGANCSLDGAGGILTCSGITLDDDESYEIVVEKVTNAANCGTLPNLVNVSAENEAEGDTENNSDEATITVDCPDVTVEKTGNGTIAAGSVAQFTIVISNNGPGTATGVSLNDDLPGSGWAIFSQTDDNCSVDGTGSVLTCSGITLSDEGSYSVVVRKTTTAADCGQLPNLVTVAAENEPQDATENNSDEATIVVECPTITGQGAIDVQKTASPTSVKEPGGLVTFSFTVRNTSNVSITVDNVVDNVFGDLDDQGGIGCFDVPFELLPNQTANCTIDRQVTGSGGTTHVNVVTVEGHDGFGHNLTDSDDARVDITPRLIDLVIVKTATSPTPLNGIVNYSMTVTNRGPDVATNVQLADPAPTGIIYLSANPSQGTCNLTPALITCSLGSINPGQTVTIAVTARATLVGTHTNIATVTGGGGRETNPADNVDDAVTVVPAPQRPPTTRPQPPAPVCLTLTVSPKMIKADGKPDTVRVLVTAGKKRMKGTKVSIFGSGVRKTGRSNAQGMAVIRINPRRAGLITITAIETNQRVCGPKRIGVVGVFLPPLTG